MPAFIFDIETGPLPDEALYRAVEPYPEFRPYPELQPFDEASVKLGNLKDEAKIKEKIEAARLSHASDHELAKSTHLADYDRGRVEYFAGIKSKAALAAETGQVLAIGFAGHDQVISAMKAGNAHEAVYIDSQAAASHGEIGLLQRFWARYTKCVSAGAPLIGFNSLAFDLPFMMRRSWLLGVTIPMGLLDKGRYWNPILVDLLAIWRCGQFGGGGFNGSISLNRLALAMGIPGKSGSGAEFARLWVEDRVAAIDYLRQDIIVTDSIAAAMGVC